MISQRCICSAKILESDLKSYKLSLTRKVVKIYKLCIYKMGILEM